MEKFEKLGLSKELLKSVKKLGFDEPTEIQEKAIPLVLDYKDIIAGSETGSGKTFAFGAGIIQNLKQGFGIQVLILAPTRELVIQIVSAMNDFARYKHMNIVPVYGGVSINPQINALKKGDIVVGTPGRILDHMQRGTLNLSKVKHFVLDEADRMLDMGFWEDVNNIMRACPDKKQTLLFSATINHEISTLAKKFMNNPVRLKLDSYVDPTKLSQVYYDVASNIKFSLLVHLLKKEIKGLVMVFCNSRVSTDAVAKGLRKVELDAMAIHGGLTQARREKVIEKFNSNKAFILVCTDVAARGLDIPGVSHVYNYDLPRESKQYVHRIGRTARAGKSGQVINILSRRDYENFTRILAENKIKIEQLDCPTIKRLDIKLDFSSDPNGNDRSRGGPRGNSRGGDRSRGGYGSRGNSRSEGRSSGPRSFGGRSRDSQRSEGSGSRSYGSRGSSGPRSEGSSSRGSSSFGGRSRDSQRSSGSGSRSYGSSNSRSRDSSGPRPSGSGSFSSRNSSGPRSESSGSKGSSSFAGRSRSGPRSEGSSSRSYGSRDASGQRSSGSGSFSDRSRSGPRSEGSSSKGSFRTGKGKKPSFRR